MVKTLVDRWDINLVEVTKLYRLAGYASPKEPEVRNSNAWLATILIQEDIAPMLHKNSLPPDSQPCLIDEKKHTEITHDTYYGCKIMRDFTLESYDVKRELDYRKKQKSEK
ncbi:MAG: hypothetical protein H9535_14615 [Ignavibacteria bacterium]|nr:hypothetical protein [Ignavibacteria bacterium]